MNRNYSVFATSVLLPVIFRNSHTVFFFNHLGTNSLYRSLGVGIGIGIGLGLDLKRRAMKEKKEDVERIELNCLMSGGGVRCLKIRRWFINKSSATAPYGAYPYPQAPWAYASAPGVFRVCDAA